MDSNCTIVNRMVVQDGRIVEVGGAIRPFMHTVHLKGKCVLPGLIDSHAHVVMRIVAQHMVSVSSFHCKQMSALLAILQRHVNEAAPSVLAFGYDFSLMDKGQPLLTQRLLDNLSTHIPIAVVHQSGHIVVANAAAMQLAQVNWPDGQGYEVPSVVRVLKAAMQVDPRWNQLPWKTALRHCLMDYARKGYTTVTDLSVGLPWPTDAVSNLTLLDDVGTVVRLQGYVAISAADELLHRASMLTSFRVLGVKIWSDGSLQGQTAAVYQPYLNVIKPTTTTHTGQLNYSLSELKRIVERYHTQGWQLAIHANGDRAISDTLDAFEQAQTAHPSPDPRFRIEHATLMTPQTMQRAQQVGATLSFTAPHVHIWGQVMRDTLGPQRADEVDSMALALQWGVPFTLNNDSPLTPVDPWGLVETAVTRHIQHEGRGSSGVLNPAQQVSVTHAIRGLTSVAAWQCFREHELGSLEVGKLADWVVLDCNPWDMVPSDIKSIQTLETYVGGKRMKW